MRISEIRNSQDFQDLCQQLLAAEYDDFEILDDSSGDWGSDGYSAAKKRLFAIYCPEKVPPPAEYYQNKIRSDLKKAIDLRDAGEYEIEEWVFITPSPLPPEVQSYFRRKTGDSDFRGIAWSEKHLTNLLYKHKHLHPLFAGLLAVDLQSEIRSLTLEVKTGFDSLMQDKTAVEELEEKFKTRVEEQYQIRFRQAKTLFDERQFVRAKSLYEDIYRDLRSDSDAGDVKQLAKAAVNIGVCAWRLEKIDEVIEWFDVAAIHAPADPKVMALKATALMYRGESEKALALVERALETDPENDDAIIAKANILLQANRHEELQRFLDQKGREELRLFFQATEFGATGRRQEAVWILRSLLSNNPDDTTYLEHLASYLLVDTQNDLKNGNRLAWRLTADERTNLEEAENLLTRLIELLTDSESFPTLVAAYVNRSAARSMLGCFKAAIADCEEILRISPGNESAYLNRAKAEMQLGDYEAASFSFENYAELTGGVTTRIARDLALSYFSSGQLDKAKETARRELDRDWLASDLDLILLAVHIFDKNFDAALADEYIARAEGLFPENSALYSLKARHEQNTGGSRVEEYLLKALELSDEARAEQTRLDLADFYYDAERYREAAELYAGLISENEFVSVNYKYLYCLYATSRFAEAIEFAKRMRDGKEVDLLISPLEGKVQQLLGNMGEAAEIFRKLYERAPANTDFLIEYGICLFRSDETERARLVFDQARNRVDKTKDLFALAYGYHFLGETLLAVDLGYRALEQSPNDPEAHLDYIKLASNLKRGEGQILDEKYAAAFQKSIATFNRRFPEQNEFKTYDLKEDLSGFYELLDQATATDIDILDYYRQRSIPASLVAEVRGINLYLTWLGLRGDRAGFSMKRGSHDELELERAAVWGDKKVVVDLFALFTLTELETSDLLPKLFETILVHQSILDELGNMTREMSGWAEKGGTYSFAKTADGKYEVSHILPEVYERSVAFLEKVRGFVRSACRVTGFERELDETEDQIVQALGWAATSPVVLARQKDLPLLSDDGVLRHQTRAELDVKGFSTFALLENAARQRIISQNRFDEACVRLLIELNYRFVPISGRALMHCASKEGFRARQKFDRVIALLCESDTNVESMAVVLGQFLALLCIQNKSWLLRRDLTKRVFRLTNSYYSGELKQRTLRYLYWELKIPENIYHEIYQSLES